MKEVNVKMWNEKCLYTSLSTCVQSQIVTEAKVQEVHSLNPAEVVIHQWHCTGLLQHSFYFYFYFEHLNFTWSYLIDTKISWSYLFDHISWSMILSWSLDLIIWWWCFFTQTLHYYLRAFDMPLTYVFHWWLTCILHMLLHNMLLPHA